jgi:hypothetical protein
MFLNLNMNTIDRLLNYFILFVINDMCCLFYSSTL